MSDTPLPAQMASPDLLAALIDAIPIGAVIWRVEDPQDGGKLRMVRPNAGASKASGVDLRQFIGQTMAEAFPLFAASGIPDQILQVALHQGKTLDLGLVEYSDDKIGSAVNTVSAYRLDDQHVVVQYRNVSEREQLLRDLAAQNAQLEQTQQELVAANEELARFAQVASHDLQAPVRQVRSFCELVLEDEPLQPEAREFLTYAVNACVHMTQLIQDLLAYARASQGDLELGPVSVQTLVDSALHQLRGPIEQARAEVTFGDLDLTVMAPRRLGSQIVFNLVGNALKFHRAGVPPVVSISATRDGDLVCITITDNGIGFDPARKAQIFEPFSRLVLQSEYAGTGIGLALCQRIAGRSGGSIDADSTPGEGSVFTLRLQAAP